MSSSRPNRPGHEITDEQRQKLLREGQKVVNDCGVVNSAHSVFTRLICEEVSGSRHPLFISLQPRVKVRESLAWLRAYAIVFAFLIEHRAKETQQTVDMEFRRSRPQAIKPRPTRIADGNQEAFRRMVRNPPEKRFVGDVSPRSGSLGLGSTSIYPILSSSNRIGSLLKPRPSFSDDDPQPIKRTGQIHRFLKPAPPQVTQSPRDGQDSNRFAVNATEPETIPKSSDTGVEEVDLEVDVDMVEQPEPASVKDDDISTEDIDIDDFEQDLDPAEELSSVQDSVDEFGSNDLDFS
jgi:hypothetical protein